MRRTESNGTDDADTCSDNDNGSVFVLINNGNGTKWSPIWSVIVRVINQI